MTHIIFVIYLCYNYVIELMFTVVVYRFLLDSWSFVNSLETSSAPLVELRYSMPVLHPTIISTMPWMHHWLVLILLSLLLSHLCHCHHSQHPSLLQSFIPGS